MKKNKRIKAEKIFGQVEKSWDLMLSDMFLLYEEELKEFDPYFYEVLRGWRYSNLANITKEEHELRERKIEKLLNKVNVGDKIKIAIYDCCEGKAIVKKIGKDKKTMLVEFIDELTMCYEKSHLESNEIHVALSDIYELKICDDKPRYYVENYWNGKRKINYSNIGIATLEDEEKNGENWTGSYDGYTFDIYGSLKEAIKNANYIADKIEFINLSASENDMAKKIVNELMSNEAYLKKFGRTLN